MSSSRSKSFEIMQHVARSSPPMHLARTECTVITLLARVFGDLLTTTARARHAALDDVFESDRNCSSPC